MKYFQHTLLNAVRKYPEFFILFTVSLIFLLPVLTGGFFLSHDSVTHVARTASYEKALSDGQLPPRWAEQANYGYGSPFMILFYPLASYLMIPLHLAGLSLESSYLVFNIIVFLLTSVGFYLWMRQLFPKAVALAAAIFYTALPYHFLIFYVRGAPGEALAFALLPFLFYCIEKISKKFSFSLILILGMLYAALMLSHNGISLIFTPIFLIYSFLRQKRAVLSVFSAIGMGLLLSAHFWLPALEEAKYTNFLYYFGNMYKEHFLYGLTPIFSSWGFGPAVNKPGGLSAQVGIPATIIFLFGVWMFLTSLRRRAQRETRTLLGFWLVLFLLGI
ncbi:MAG: glycosyltransferase family 39 protein, partial [Candidatus Levybacteria bacterium]|nr:glycosyltransferase family 39 protein [Candidatus Levybacteria bacterium]